MNTFRALVVDKVGDGVALTLADWSPDRLMAGDVTIRVEYSSVNYKDGLAVRADGRVVRSYPLIPGIDLAGKVVASTDGRFTAGDREQIRLHPYLTDRILSRLPGLAPLAAVAAQHHERLDGSGYPTGATAAASIRMRVASG